MGCGASVEDAGEEASRGFLLGKSEKGQLNLQKQALSVIYYYKHLLIKLSAG